MAICPLIRGCCCTVLARPRLTALPIFTSEQYKLALPFYNTFPSSQGGQQDAKFAPASQVTAAVLES